MCQYKSTLMHIRVVIMTHKMIVLKYKRNSHNTTDHDLIFQRRRPRPRNVSSSGLHRHQTEIRGGEGKSSNCDRDLCYGSGGRVHVDICDTCEPKNGVHLRELFTPGGLVHRTLFINVTDSIVSVLVR